MNGLHGEWLCTCINALTVSSTPRSPVQVSFSEFAHVRREQAGGRVAVHPGEALLEPTERLQR